MQVDGTKLASHSRFQTGKRLSRQLSDIWIHRLHAKFGEALRPFVPQFMQRPLSTTTRQFEGLELKAFFSSEIFVHSFLPPIEFDFLSTVRTQDFFKISATMLKPDFFSKLNNHIVSLRYKLTKLGQRVISHVLRRNMAGLFRNQNDPIVGHC